MERVWDCEIAPEEVEVTKEVREECAVHSPEHCAKEVRRGGK